MEDSIEINGYKHMRYIPQPTTADEALQQSRTFFKSMLYRRSIRDFSEQSFSIEIIENIIKTAASAPSGANKQPWTFVVVSNPSMKTKIRKAAEKEEELSYSSRMNEQWLKDLAPLGTDSDKPFLEKAPYLIIVFKKSYDLDKKGEKRQNYYVNESVGIATGFLITAIQQAGLATLTHTPSPMNFLSDLLERPANEKPFLLLPVGFAADEVYVPDINKKPLSEVMIYYE